MSSPFFRLKELLETKGFLLFCAGFFVLFQILSHFSLWVETELFPVHSSRHLWSPQGEVFLFSLKPFFYTLLYLSHLMSSALSFNLMDGARFLFALNGLLILLLMYLYIRQKTDRYNAVLAVLVLASASIFLDRGFRVRSDLLLSSVSLAALLISLNRKEQKNHNFYIAIALLMSLPLISPKGIYWIIWTLCLMLHDLKGKKIEYWPLVKTGFGVYTAFLLFSFALKDPFFLKSIGQSALFYLSTVKMNWSFLVDHGWMEMLSVLSHTRLFIEKNPQMVGLILVKAIFVFYSVAISKQRKWDLSDLYFFVLIVILLLHPQVKLFFLCSAMPFVLISFFTDSLWKKWSLHGFSPPFKAFFLLAIFLLASFYTSFFCWRVWTRKSNQTQRQVIEKLNDFYKTASSSVSIFDPACILYKRKSHCKFLVSGALSEDKKIKSFLKKHDFDLVLSSFNLPLFTLTDYKKPPFIYIDVGNQIFYKAFVMDLRQTGLEEKERAMLNKEGTNLSYSFPHSLRLAGGLSGKQTLKAFLSALGTKEPDSSFRKYSYFWFGSGNKILRGAKPCGKPQSRDMRGGLVSLQSGCPYSKEDFEQGFIPLEGERLALFYLPFPPDLPEETFLSVLLRFDVL